MMKVFLQSVVLVCFVLGASAVHGQDDQEAKEQRLTEQDRVRIAVQKICPVSGKELGSMGDPIKAKVSGEQAYLCCQGCVGQEINAQHWKTIQANFAKAQGECPIMGKPVDATMESTLVEGQRIYVCCPPCIEKIEADPAASLKKLHAAYGKVAMSEMLKQNDQLQVSAQAICPVSGKKLGSMGEPVKVQVGEQETAFLCCKSCVGQKIDAALWTQVQENLAKAQGTCPVMGKPVDASMEFAVVNGRKVFVCCPPCIEKIEAEPMTFLAKVNAQVKKNLSDNKD